MCSRILAHVGLIRFGPARVPSRESPDAAIEILQDRGSTACEIDFEGKFWMDYPWAERFGELARDARIVLSVHAPIAGFMGHAERGKKLNMAIGMLDHSAGVAKACGAELVVFHPGFLLGRTREDAIESVVEQLGELRERLEKKDRAVPFGIEVMGRVRELGTAEDVFAISARCGWVRPVLDFAHMHATSDGAFTSAASSSRSCSRRNRAYGGSTSSSVRACSPQRVISMASRKRVSASLSRSCAARTSASATRVVARDVRSSALTVSRAASAYFSAS